MGCHPLTHPLIARHKQVNAQCSQPLTGPGKHGVPPAYTHPPNLGHKQDNARCSQPLTGPGKHGVLPLTPPPNLGTSRITLGVLNPLQDPVNMACYRLHHPPIWARAG